MSGDPGAVSAALQAAFDAFEHGGTPEEGMSQRPTTEVAGLPVDSRSADILSEGV